METTVRGQEDGDKKSDFVAERVFQSISECYTHLFTLTRSVVGLNVVTLGAYAVFFEIGR